MAWLGAGVSLISVLVLTLLPAVVSTSDNSVDNIYDSVRWVISEFGECSTKCGGGIQVRTVRCVSSFKKHGRIKETRVPETVCPSPTPHVTKSCNNQECSGHWISTQWSECSATCGIGTQNREVTCQRSPRQKGRHHLYEAECGGSAPESSRKCHLSDCLLSDKSPPHSILSENYTLIQLHRTRKIKVNIGGQVNLLPGQTIVVKCPVKNYSKKLVYWSKGYRLVPFMGRVRSTRGGLYIAKGKPLEDAGVYTCIAGDQTASITVTFIKKDDPSTKLFKKWVEKSNRQNHKYQGKYTNGGLENRDVWKASSINGLEELNQQRDQSHNSSNFMNYVISDWSPCSTTCGAVGHRKRTVSCSQITTNYVKVVSDSHCQLFGLDKPDTMEQCSGEGNCSIWQPGPWSTCLPTCGGTGQMNRLLTCVWEATGQLAGTACESKNKPAVSKPCKTRPCSSGLQKIDESNGIANTKILAIIGCTCPKSSTTGAKIDVSYRYTHAWTACQTNESNLRKGVPCVILRVCKDDSEYCSLTRLLKLCRLHYFRQQCCQTCYTLANSPS